MVLEEGIATVAQGGGAWQCRCGCGCGMEGKKKRIGGGDFPPGDGESAEPLKHVPVVVQFEDRGLTACKPKFTLPGIW